MISWNMQHTMNFVKSVMGGAAIGINGIILIFKW